MDDPALAWLLEDINPAVRYRTLTQLLGMEHGSAEAAAAREALLRWLPQATDPAWQTDVRGLWLIYHLTALAEAGLTAQDTDISAAVDRLLALPFDGGCGDAMALRALVMLGCESDERVRRRLHDFAVSQLPDGGFLCLHRLPGLRHIPKGCYKACTQALMLYGECAKRGIDLSGREALIDYFFRRGIFYRMDDPARLVLDAREGWRTIDTFYPVEPMRVGIQCLAEAFAALGVGGQPQLMPLWQRMDSLQDDRGRTLLLGTMTKSYLPREKVGQPSRWATLYARLARQRCTPG